MSQPWRTRSRRTLLDLHPWLSVERHVVELPDGRVIEDWPWVVGREYVNVLAVNEDGLFLLFRQTKYAVEGTTLAPVGGYLEEGEDPLVAARRELLEETGHEAPDWRPLGRYVVDGNRGAGVSKGGIGGAPAVAVLNRCLDPRDPLGETLQRRRPHVEPGLQLAAVLRRQLEDVLQRSGQPERLHIVRLSP